MDLLATILTCSLYASDDAVVRAIAEGPSDPNPYFVTNTAVVETEPLAPPKTEAEATLRSAELVAQGGKPLLRASPRCRRRGSRPSAGRSVSAFDPCINVAIGTAMRSEFDAACATKGSMPTERARMLERTNRRVCVLRNMRGGHEHARRLRRRHPARKLSVQKPAIASIEDAPIFAPLERTHLGA